MNFFEFVFKIFHHNRLLFYFIIKKVLINYQWKNNYKSTI